MNIHSYLKDKTPYVLPSTPELKYKLDIVENLYPVPPEVEEDIKLAVKDLHSYPTANELLELALLTKEYTKHEGEILFTNGSDSALKLLIDTYFTPESRVGIFIPTYPHFVQMAKNTYSKLTYIPCMGEEDLLELAPQLGSYNILYICSPNLPLGYTITKGIEILLEEYPQTLVIVDEAYVEYGGKSNVPLLSKYKNLIITRTFSKFFALASLRIGYLLACREVIEVLKITHNAKSVSKIACVGACSALRNISFYNQQLIEFKETREYLALHLPRTLGDEIYSFNLGNGNFFLLYTKNPQKICEIFARVASTAIRDKSLEIKDAVRLSIAPLSIMKMVLRVIRYINKYPFNNFILDLDGTVRPDSKLTSTVSCKTIDLLRSYPCIILTNNTVHTKEEIRRQITIDDIEIITPSPPRNSFVIGKGYSNERSLQEYSSVCILNSVLDVGSDVWAQACKILAQKKPLYIVEDTACTACDFSSETFLSGPEYIPDVGIFLEIFDISEYYVIGKPYLKVPHNESSIVVGDSEGDWYLAQKHELEFIKVQKDLTEVKIDCECTRIPSLDYLIL